MLRCAARKHKQSRQLWLYNSFFFFVGEWNKSIGHLFDYDNHKFTCEMRNDRQQKQNKIIGGCSIARGKWKVQLKWMSSYMLLLRYQVDDGLQLCKGAFWPWTMDKSTRIADICRVKWQKWKMQRASLMNLSKIYFPWHFPTDIFERLGHWKERHPGRQNKNGDESLPADILWEFAFSPYKTANLSVPLCV